MDMCDTMTLNSQIRGSIVHTLEEECLGEGIPDDPVIIPYKIFGNFFETADYSEFLELLTSKLGAKNVNYPTACDKSELYFSIQYKFSECIFCVDFGYGFVYLKDIYNIDFCLTNTEEVQRCARNLGYFIERKLFSPDKEGVSKSAFLIKSSLS